MINPEDGAGTMTSLIVNTKRPTTHRWLTFEICQAHCQFSLSSKMPPPIENKMPNLGWESASELAGSLRLSRLRNRRSIRHSRIPYVLTYALHSICTVYAYFRTHYQVISGLMSYISYVMPSYVHSIGHSAYVYRQFPAPYSHSVHPCVSAQQPTADSYESA